MEGRLQHSLKVSTKGRLTRKIGCAPRCSEAMAFTRGGQVSSAVFGVEPGSALNRPLDPENAEEDVIVVRPVSVLGRSHDALRDHAGFPERSLFGRIVGCRVRLHPVRRG